MAQIWNTLRNTKQVFFAIAKLFGRARHKNFSGCAATAPHLE
jgi:hypothetical protein